MQGRREEVGGGGGGVSHEIFRQRQHRIASTSYPGSLVPSRAEVQRSKGSKSSTHYLTDRAFARNVEPVFIAQVVS